jgi:LPXTG-motif cell wall-anchored protein
MDTGAMTVRRTLLVVSVVGWMTLAMAAASASEVAVIDLLDDGAAFDGATITVTGELVGDYGSRLDGSTWTQLNQDRYVVEPIADGGRPLGGNIGIGVRVPSELLSGASAPGRYRQVGPVVSLTGTWRYHDPGRQGESYLDVETLVTVRDGTPLSEPPDWWALAGGVVMLAAGGGLLAARRRRAAAR